MKKHKQLTQGGFTLIELLVVIGILAILLAITLIAINPNKHFQDTRNAQRQSDVTAMLDAIYEYESAHTGNVSPNAGTATLSATHISSTGIDLCELAPTYIADLPTDPSAGTVSPSGNTPCQAGTTSYDTGYTIVKTASGRFTIAAPSAEDSATISVTR